MYFLYLIILRDTIKFITGLTGRCQFVAGAADDDDLGRGRRGSP